MTFLDLWKKREYTYFEDWLEKFTGKGLSLVVNKGKMIQELVLNWKLLTDYLKREKDKNGNTLTAEQKVEALKVLLAYVLELGSGHYEYLQGLPKKEFAQELGENSLLLGRALKEENKGEHISHLTVDACIPFLQGLGPNIKFLFAGLNEEVLHLSTDIRSPKIILILRPFAKELAEGLGSNVYILATEQVLQLLGNHVEEFGKYLGEHARQFGDHLAHHNYNFKMSPTFKVIDLLRGLGKQVEFLIEGMTLAKRQGASLLLYALPLIQYGREIGQELKENAFYFGRGLRKEAKSVARVFFHLEAHSFFDGLGPNILLFAQGLGLALPEFVTTLCESKEAIDRFAAALGDNMQAFLDLLPNRTRNTFVRALHPSRLTLELLRAQQCAYCKQPLQKIEAILVCSKCQTLLHNECASEIANICPTLGCDGHLVGIARKKQQPAQKK